MLPTIYIRFGMDNGDEMQCSNASKTAAKYPFKALKVIGNSTLACNLAVQQELCVLQITVQAENTSLYSVYLGRFEKEVSIHQLNFVKRLLCNVVMAKWHYYLLHTDVQDSGFGFKLRFYQSILPPYISPGLVFFLPFWKSGKDENEDTEDEMHFD